MTLSLESPKLLRYRALWRALRAGNVAVSEHGSGLESVVLSDGVGWLTEANSTMLVRASWRVLHGRVAAAMGRRVEMNGFLVTGDPGVGKSWFLSYELLHAARDNRDIVFESVESGLIWHFALDDSVTEYPAASLHSISAVNNIDTLYLFDPAGGRGPAREPLRCAAFTLICASPNPAHYHNFMKHTSESTVRPGKAYMPQPSLEELQEMRTACFTTISADVVDERFALFGGVARFAFADPEDHEQNVIALRSAVGACSAESVVDSIREVEAQNDVSHRLVRYAVAADLKSVVSVEFASRAIATMVCEKLEQAAGRAVRKLANSLRGVDGGAFGTIFEFYAHKRLAAGGTFACVALGAAAAMTELVVPQLPVHEMRTASDVVVALGPAAWRPIVPNYPAFDGFMQLAARSPVDALQMKTTRGPHSISARTFSRGCPGTVVDALRLFWVVPLGPEFESFREPTVHVPRDRAIAVSQYKLGVNL